MTGTQKSISAVLTNYFFARLTVVLEIEAMHNVGIRGLAHHVHRVTSA